MKIIFTILLLVISIAGFSQYDYIPTQKNPYGLPNPNAADEIKDYADLIGISDCSSVSRNPDRTWADTVSMQWTFKYIMNGMGVQDVTYKSDGAHSGSLRYYNVDSSRWYVHYFSPNSFANPLSIWEGGTTENGDILLLKDQPAPNGMAGDYRITFSEINENGFKWTGEWVDKARKFIFPTWKITCVKRKE